jgi:hypothetical protein
MSKDYQIAVYYFPNYHPDARNAIVHGPGWTEWEVVNRATPRFPDHYQPRVPTWGYTDESDPLVMEQKINAAADHGIDAFIYDWYWYDDGPFIERGLEQGFMKAPNADRLKFAIMWANHDWKDIHPAKLDECRGGRYRTLYPGKVTPETFEQIVKHTIEVYFKHPSYWKIDGAPYYSIYDQAKFIECFGSLDAAREALAYFRAETKAAGFADLHLNQVLWNSGVLPGEAESRGSNELLKILGYDSFTSYVWVHHVPLKPFPCMDYMEAFRIYMDYWQKAEGEIDLPYYPNASVGWDSSPRTVQSEAFLNAGYPFTASLIHNEPEQFKAALQAIKAKMDAGNGPKILTMNSWNEWTEGSYLEPDERYGMGYLEAIRAVFG